MGFLSMMGNKTERVEARAAARVKIHDDLLADRVKKIGERTVWIQKYGTSGGFNNDAARMSEIGFEVISQASNRHGGGLTVTYRKSV